MVVAQESPRTIWMHISKEDKVLIHVLGPAFGAAV